MSRIYLPEPHENQQPILNDDSRFKLIRAGRRFGKDRLAMHAAVLGHGNGRWKGIIDGVDVAWIGPDYPQIRAIWREEVESRFNAVDGVTLRRQERTITFRGLGSLEFRSAEAIDSVRGRKLGGVVLNEAAYFDLEYALKEVIMPALIDLGGWVIIISTPNASNDGHETAEGKRTPSFFNMLCEQFAAGALGKGWKHWHYTSRDNPKIPRDEVELLYREYEPDSPEVAQELDAKLIVAGTGVAFPEWNDEVHLTDYLPETDPRYRWSGGGDWGYRRNGGLWLMATGPERSIVRHEFYFKETAPYDVGYQWAKMTAHFPRAEWMAVDEPAVADGGPTILEELQRGVNDGLGLERGRGGTVPAFVAPPKGPGSRITKKALLHEHLKYTRADDGTVPPWGLPRLLFHRTACPNLVRTLQRLPRDPKKHEDVDTTAEDDPYDGVTSWLMARTPHVERERRIGVPKHPDDHPGASRYEPVTTFADEEAPRWSRDAW